MKRELFAVLAVAVGLLVAGPTFAHHSTAIYDKQNVTTVTGTVTGFEFINPHVQIHLDVKKDNGEFEKWTGISSPPNALRRAGWSRNTLKPGDLLTMGGLRVKDGRPILAVEKLVLADGTEIPLRLDD